MCQSCWSCGLCAACRPKYQRLVDSIYPADPAGGLVKANMQKLTFYAISHPEKLDGIGEYIAYKMGRDLYRQRMGNVRVAAEAMDQLLAACHGSPGLNLFVESFLKVVQKLLETNDAGLEIMATRSFVNFSNIEEDIPGYHRRYDFFISKFSSLCHNNDSNLAVRDRLRVAGLKGLRGVVRKTALDDLQANIWDRQHMEKIVPSILFNFHDRGLDERPGADANVDDTEAGNEQPKVLADTCFRELVGKASFGSMKSVLTPVLRHCDNHNLWIPPADHAVAVFRAVMYSIQNQYLHVVIQMLIAHLDQHGTSRAELRIGMATVLSEIVLIAASSIGPGLLEIFNSMLRHLRSSVELQLSDDCQSEDAEKRYQETLINTMGDFANSLPDYQKVEIMMFIIGKVPMGDHRHMKRSDSFLQHVLMKTLLKVATKYCTVQMGAALPGTFLEPLLRLALVDNANVRLLTQHIIHTLIDRHQNLHSLQHVRFVTDVDELNLSVEKCSRADQMFMHKNGTQLLSTIFRCATEPRLANTNSTANYDALLCTMLLLVVELGCDDVMVDLYRLAFAMQQCATEQGPNQQLAPLQRVRLHQLVAWFMNVSCQLLSIPSLVQHVRAVCKQREQQSRVLLDPLQTEEVDVDVDDIDGAATSSPTDSTTDVIMADAAVTPSLRTRSASMTADDPSGVASMSLIKLDDEMLFSKQTVAESLQASGKDVTRLALPFTPRVTSDLLQSRTGSPTVPHDVASISFSIGGSVDSSPENRHSRRNTIFGHAIDQPDDRTPLTVERLKELVAQTPEALNEQEEQEAARIAAQFSNRPFHEIVALVKQQQRPTQENIARIMQRVKDREAAAYDRKPPANVFEIELPEMFVY